jgi:hypothetical protein
MSVLPKDGKWGAVDLIEQKPVVPPLQRHLQMETDFFCHQCGYNLHGQIVTRDERLDIMICRCPECGCFHPAALGVSATRPWLARLGVILIFWWVTTILAVFGAAGFFQGLMSFAHLEIFTIYDQSDQRNFRFDLPRIVRTPTPQNQYYHERQEVAWKMLGSLSIALSVVFGGFCAAVMWHVPKNRLYLVLLWPILAALITYWLWWANYNIERIVGWSITRLAIYAAVNVAAMAVGLQIGRPVARFLLKVLVPPRLRQHVHFLWTWDGLQPPGISGVSGVSA